MEFYRVGRDGYNHAIIHVIAEFSDGSRVDELFTSPPYTSPVEYDTFECWLTERAARTERDCKVHSRADNPPLVTDAFGWHKASRTENGSIRIESGYDGHSALSWENDEEYQSMADYFRQLR